MKRTCGNCKKSFNALPSIVKKGWGLSCSRKCQYITAHNGTWKPCETCGKKFYARAVDLKKRNRGKYCSRVCFINGPKHSKKRILCSWCKESMLTTEGKIKRGKKYCSKKCYSQSAELVVDRKCTRCNIIFKVNPSVVKNGGGLYCSHKCRKLQKGICIICKEKKIVRSSGMCKKCHTANDNMLRNYGLSLAEVNKHKKEGCQICKGSKRLFVDHDHATKKFRGILCPDCNFLLGAAKDSVLILKKAILYLKDNQDTGEATEDLT